MHVPWPLTFQVNDRIKRIVAVFLDPKSIILAIALGNFIFIWVEARNLATSGIACLVCPWYDPWSYLNEPSLLLVAAAFLRLSRILALIISMALSGYLLSYFVYLFLAYDVSLKQEWRYLRTFEPYFVGSWESQYFLALIILSFSIFYLTRFALRKRALKHHAKVVDGLAD